MSRTCVVVSGTTTGVGKTWVAARLIELLKREAVQVAARKPVQSYDESDGPTDAQLLADASGEKQDVVCAPHLAYPLPLAPPLAAEALGRPPISLAELDVSLDLPTAGVVIIEGVGGPRSPLTDDADTTDLARVVDADVVVLVAEPGLGAINAVCLSVEALAHRRVVVFLNRFDATDDTQVRNRDWLRDVENLEVVTDLDELVAAVRACADQAAAS